MEVARIVTKEGVVIHPKIMIPLTAIVAFE
jgi:hypothetical protein